MANIAELEQRVADLEAAVSVLRKVLAKRGEDAQEAPAGAGRHLTLLKGA